MLLQVILSISTSGMGRVKIEIKRLEKNTGRQSTYSKRKNGLFKKASELSVLCDIDIVLLMFSPSGKPALYKGENSSIEGIIEKFSQLNQLERTTRKLEILEALKKTFRKSDHDVNIQDFLGPCYQSVEDLTTQAKLLRTQVSAAQKKLSYWTNQDKIDSVEHLEQMEVSLHTSLNLIRTHKVNLAKLQEEIQLANQFQDAMDVPFSLDFEEHLQPLSWIPDYHTQHVVLLEELNLLPQRDSEGLGSYSGFFRAGEKLDITKIGRENGIVDEFSRTESLSLQLHEKHRQQMLEQHPYSTYDFGLLSDKNFQPIAQMNVQQNTLNCDLDRKFEVPRPGYDPTQHSWASTSGTCAGTTCDGNLYAQENSSKYQESRCLLQWDLHSHLDA